MDRLPVLLSIPHDGDIIPDELKNRTSLSAADILEDGDTLTRLLYGFKDKVAAYIDTDIARTFIDLNRSPDDRPPVNADGVIKSMTIKNTPVYKKKRSPDSILIDSLLDKYYYPYHQKIDVLQKQSGIRLALDCHSMLPTAPTLGSAKGAKRPMICLSNGGNEKGEPTTRKKTITCPPESIQLMANCFADVFELNQSNVKLNHPFTGGHIIHSHFNGSIPWIQIEINKKLYLNTLNHQLTTRSQSFTKLEKIKDNIWRALQLFFLNY